MAMVGNLHDFSFSELLHILGRGSKTGQLSVWAPSGIAHIWFYQGRIVCAAPPGQTSNLQQQLALDVELQSKCSGSSEQVLSKLASLCCPVNQPLGSCLRKQGLISPSGLVRAFRQQLNKGVYILFELENGHFKFKSTAPMPYGEMTGLSKDCMDIALEGLRRLEMQKQQLINLPDESACFRRSSDDLPSVRLSPIEWSVWEQVSPHRQLRHIALELETELVEIQQVCGRLLHVGLIQATAYLPPLPTRRPEASDPNFSTVEKDLSNVSGSLLRRLTAVLRGIQKGSRPALAKSRS